MQTKIDLWLWRYFKTRQADEKYHLRADELACRNVIQRLREPSFVKVSFALLPVPEAMTRVLSVRDPRFISFETLRVFRTDENESAAIFEEKASGIDLRLNSGGIAIFTEALELMLDGQQDFRMMEIWFWGSLSETELRKKFK
jgi:hypothetical protein